MAVCVCRREDGERVFLQESGDIGGNGFAIHAFQFTCLLADANMFLDGDLTGMVGRTHVQYGCRRQGKASTQRSQKNKGFLDSVSRDLSGDERNRNYSFTGMPSVFIFR